jgi:hypothetical protein
MKRHVGVPNKKFNKFPLVFRGVDSYLPRFTSPHGQNVVDSRGAINQSESEILNSRNTIFVNGKAAMTSLPNHEYTSGRTKDTLRSQV